MLNICNVYKKKYESHDTLLSECRTKNSPAVFFIEHVTPSLFALPSRMLKIIFIAQSQHRFSPLKKHTMFILSHISIILMT
jgi:hypothetical protein